MLSSNRELYKGVIKSSFLICATVALCHATHGFFAVAIAVSGLFFALTHKNGKALCCYAFLPLLTELNPILMNSGGIAFALSVRFGALFIGLLLAIVARRSLGRHHVPIGSLAFYLVVSCVSSMDGWQPKISYFKLINFSVFMGALMYGTHNLDSNYGDLIRLRNLFLGMAVFVILGSAALIPFPGISELSGLDIAKAEGATVAEANEIMRSMDSYQTLFCGVTNQSQTLGPLLGQLFAWVLLDMLLVEKHFSKLHVLLLITAMPLLYYTRSRCALLVLATGFLTVYFYALPKIMISSRLKQKLHQGLIVLLVMMCAGAGIAEVRNQTISRWLRKSDDVSADSRSMGEAVTESRLGKIEESMRDFHMNPLWGMGFQVAEITRSRRAKGFVLSSPIEKGVLPTMILGEAGVVGALAFWAFLIIFYSTCTRKRYLATATSMTVFLAANMGEATFFSPGGSGGVMWMIAIVGGFTLDCLVINDARCRSVRMG